MDPNATLRELQEGIDAEKGGKPFRRRDVGRYQELMEALHGWLAIGGFRPDWTKYPDATRQYREYWGIE